MNPTLPSAEQLLRRHHRRMRTAWPLAVIAIGLAATLAAGWWRPWISDAKKENAKTNQQAVNTPKAAIKWKTPEAETKAAPIEEVPLEAVADSTSGLRDLALEVEVNGDPRPSIPILLDEIKA